jgi:mRNA degradation ribonuclease J1/J2
MRKSGMIRLERALDELSRDGFEVLHDLDVGFARVSHCVVGPTGVFAIEPEGRAEPSKVVGEAHRLERLLHAAGMDEPVHAVVTDGTEVTELVRKPEPRLHEDTVDRIRVVLKLYCRRSA